MLKSNCDLCNKIIQITKQQLEKNNHHFCSIYCSNYHRNFNIDRTNKPRNKQRLKVIHYNHLYGGNFYGRN